MRFRRILLPLIRLWQCSGLCPISVYGSNAISESVETKIGFALSTAITLFLQLFVAVHFFTHSNYYIDWSKSHILGYIRLFGSITLRLHAIVVLIESYAKRSIQLRVLEKFDEIEDIFVVKLKIPTNDERVRRRCRRIIIFWISKYAAFVIVIFVGGIMLFQWVVFYQLMMLFAPVYTCTLFYAQLVVYLDMIKYNLEMINDCLAKLKELPRIRWHHQRHHAITSTDICQQLTHLRRCYGKTWETSSLINRCVRWSLFLGVTSDFTLYVANLYWIRHYIFNAPDKLGALVIFLLWIAINMSNFLLVSRICDQILAEVSTLLGWNRHVNISCKLM